MSHSLSIGRLSRAAARTLRIAALALVSFVAACGGGSDNDPTLVQTDKGTVRGRATGTAIEFLGIPYAAAPTGALRWKPPQAAAAWAGERDATQIAAHCPQPDTPFGSASVTEDCLFLSVRRPQGDGPFPVMVWIHGGGLWLGQSDEYDPTRIVQEGAVVVTLNYRLGILGFLSHPALSGESADAVSGNYGLLDQQAALRWVRDNIARFGGDPGNVTLFGESAGGLSVSSQLASPAAAGLFHKAIIQSGSYSLEQPPLAAAETNGLAFGNAAGCAAQDLACLRGLTVAQVLTAQGFPPTGYVPTVDGKLLPRSVAAAFDRGQFNRMPMMAGSNGNEFSLLSAFLFDLVPAAAGGLGPVTDANYPSALAITLQVFGIDKAPAAVDAEYAGAALPSRADTIDAIGTDGAFACRAREAVRRLSQYTSVYAYEFNDPNAPMFLLPPVRAAWGAFHASELQYLFDLPVRAGATPTAFTADQRRLAAEMVASWTRFARSGMPNTGAATWPAYTAAADSVLSLEPAASQVSTSFATRHRCAFWSAG